MNPKYRVFPYVTDKNGIPVERFKVMSLDGKEVAICNTIKFANRCCAALNAFSEKRNLTPTENA